MALAFPSDDFIFGRIRQWNLTAPASRKIQINGHQIPQDMLTSDYFDIKWYVLKDQENSWHIDGMLIPKYAKLRATKQFLGVSDAFAAAKDGYTITVTERNPRAGQSADTHVLTMHYSNGAVTWTYTMNGTSYTGTQNGTKWTFTDNSGNLLATVDSSDGGNRLSWALHRLIPMTAYDVVESGYASGTYAVTTSHVIENTPQTSNLSGGDSAVVERVYNYPNYMAETSYQTVAFRNLYTIPWVMTIFKQDGNTLHGLDHVTFDLEVKDSNNAVVTDIPSVYTTTSDGQISVVFPEEAGSYTFTLTERAHEGYDAITTITGNVNVTDQGVVTVSNLQGGVTGANTMFVLDSNNNAIVYIKNMPERVNVKVEKEWATGATALPVTMQLLRNNIPLSGKTIVLGATQADATADPTHYTTAWNYTWTNLPAYIDGRKVVYSAREEWIGEPGGVNSIHYNLANDPSDGYVDYIVYQTQSETTDGSLTTITVKMENTPDDGQLVFTKVDTGNKPVAGAVFRVYKEQDETKPYVTFTSGSDGVVTIQTSALQLFINANYSGQSVYGEYWMKETPPAGYVSEYTNWYKLDISEHNSKLYYTEDNGATYTVLYPAVIENQPFTAHVKVVKKGINNAILAGVRFALYRTATNLVPMRGYANLVTDQNGEIDLGELPQGTYYLKEIEAPEGYQLLTERIPITVTDDRNAVPVVVSATFNGTALAVSNSSNTYTITVPNKPTGQGVKIRKQDSSNNNNIQGAQFKIYTTYDANDASQNVEYIPEQSYLWNGMNSIWGGSTSNIYTTNDDGWIYNGYLPIGRYYIVETDVPKTDAGYPKYEMLTEPAILEVTESSLILTGSGNTSSTYGAYGPKEAKDVYISNIPVGTISVSKTVQVDGTGSTELADQTITFGLFTSQPTVESTTTNTYTMTLGSSATTTAVAFTGLHMGTYWVYEVDSNNHPILNGNTVAVNGHTYTVSETMPNVTLTNAGDTGTVSITNGRLTGALKITKAVTVNGANDTTSVTNGTYSFSITGVAGTATAGENHTAAITFANGQAIEYQIDSGTVQFVSGTDNAVVLTNLIPGDYVISETVPSDMTLTITGGKNGTISGSSVTATVTAGDTTPTSSAAQVEFTNTLGIISVPLTAQKTMKGRTIGAEDNYSFTLTAAAGTPMPEDAAVSGDNTVKTVSNDSTGTVSFGTITYRLTDMGGQETKDFTYTVRETAGSVSGIKYDPAVYTVTVRVVNTNGVLSIAEGYPVYRKAVASAPATTETAITFENEELLDIEATKTWKNSAGADINSAIKNAEVTYTLYKKVGDAGAWEAARDITEYQIRLHVENLANADAWKTGWEKLPKYENNQPVFYKVVETEAKVNNTAITLPSPAEAEATSASYGTVANHSNPTAQVKLDNTLPTVNITVKKTWSGAATWLDNNLKVEMTLKANGYPASNLPLYNSAEQNAAIWLTSEEAVTGKTWYDLPKYDDTGAEIVYTVEETSMMYGNTVISNWDNIFTRTQATVSSASGSTVTIDNTLTETTIQVTKVWTNNGTQRTDKTSVGFSVHQVYGSVDTALDQVWTSVGDAAAEQTNTPAVNYVENSGWQIVTVSKLPKYVRTEAGYTEAAYYVVETGVTGNTAITYQKNSGTEGEAAAQATNNGETITIYNRDASVNIKIVKIDESTRGTTHTRLPNAAFKLYRLRNDDYVDYPGESTNVQATDASGELTFTALPEGSYKIIESAAPAGYNSMTGAIYFTIGVDGTVTWTDKAGKEISSQSMVGYTAATITDPATFTVGNTPGVELPSTGGTGTTIYTLTGLTLLLGAALWLFLRRKREQN